MAMKSMMLAGLMMAFSMGAASAVSVPELAGKCGDDGKAWCEGVGYGEPMQTCLNQNYKKLMPQCKAVMDRINGGERVTLF